MPARSAPWINHFDTVVTMADDTIAAIDVCTPSSALWRDNEVFEAGEFIATTVDVGTPRSALFRDNETFDMQENTNLLLRENALLIQLIDALNKEMQIRTQLNELNQKLNSQAQELATQRTPAAANHVAAQPSLHPPTRQQQHFLQQQHKVPAAALVPAIVVITTDATCRTATPAPPSTSSPPRLDSCHRGLMSRHKTTCHSDFIRATRTPFHSATHRRWDPGKDNTIIDEQQQ